MEPNEMGYDLKYSLLQIHIFWWHKEIDNLFHSVLQQKKGNKTSKCASVKSYEVILDIFQTLGFLDILA